MIYGSKDFSGLLTVLSISGRTYTPPHEIKLTELPAGIEPMPAYRKSKERKLIAKVWIRGANLTEIKENFRLNIAPFLFAGTIEYQHLIFDDEPNVLWKAIVSSEIEPREEKAGYIIADIEFTAKGHSFATSETIIAASDPFTEISGTVTGTVANKGSIYFEIGDVSPPSSFTVTVGNGAIVLVPYETFTLSGDWEIDLTKRIVKKDGVLAQKYIDFSTSEFEKCLVEPGAFSINFSSAVVSGYYIYRAEYL